MSKIILSADRTCDIGAELQEKYSVNIISYPITLGEGKYLDSIDIFPDDLYAQLTRRNMQIILKNGLMRDMRLSI